MKCYLASWYSSREEMGSRAIDLHIENIEVTSRWIEEDIYSPTSQIQEVEYNYLRDTARDDIQDILKANIFVLNTPDKDDLSNPDMHISTWARGGRHFEAGLFYATMLFFQYLPAKIRDIGTRQMILVGRRENVFHYLDDIEKNGQALGLDLPKILCFDTWQDAKEYLVEIYKAEEMEASV